MKKYTVLNVFFIFLVGTVFSQKKQNSFKYIEVTSHYGSYFYSGEGLQDTGILDLGYGGLDVKFGWQPSNEKHWASMYGYPSYGFGAYVGFLGNSKVFGNPNALFGFINFPIGNQNKKNVFSVEPAVGIAYNFNAFDPESNPLNDAIGAKAAVYFSLDFGGRYQLTRELDFKYGIDFTHFSNGRTYSPNYGLNMFGINLGLRYNYNSKQKELDRNVYTTNTLVARFQKPMATPKEKINDHNISFYAAIGTVQNVENKGTDHRYGTFSGVIEYQYRLNVMSGFSAGIDFFYDGSLTQYTNKHLMAAHIGYDLMFWKLEMKFQALTYITDSKGKSNFFFRPALRYNISKRFFAQVGLKTDGGADWVEYGIGFKPFNW
ncbi:acyloxyacyl hydrolase [uncultured Tenacibaculum sp.]|uniref:acyloxyacyl hydrolase n=1 Tax=uncultured Tenacibaculum sp. TaxID=174713 RepID=UPI002625D52E|nr:acyloxyacyl hydrolase [uncultured Tenacibaculum sp.]